MNKPPAYSDRGRAAVATLYTPYNDLTIFVEDKSLPHLYYVIFQRMFNDRLKIRRVIPLGGKRKVISEFKAYRSGVKRHPEPCFFVLDRDLDPYIGNDQIVDDAIIYLEEYCIENYLIEECSVLRALQWKLNDIPDNIATIVNYKGWLGSIIDPFFNLFISFAVCRLHDLGENASISPFVFIENNGYLVDNLKVENYLSKLKERYCLKYGKNEDDFNVEIENMRQVITHAILDNITTAISGKYLLASLIRYVNFICEKKADEKFFIGLLANNFDISRLDYAKNKIIGLCKIGDVPKLA
ncbi:DUF4435 domain-containing protein [Heliobacterium undosum]|uniref:DUF4435 domain-containing protein n=1 Tax=Heliomicrobium undosum TaxID=121734 RepID=A0A845LEU8_9FIRM|nr:DUF4435 domain-containing protein [Heliomicrobium undosum]MZP31451.1 DUF4435 domain-containing protein [Heliomicrobium undosum]